MSIRLKIVLALAITAVLSAFPLGRFILDRQTDAVLRQQAAQGEVNSRLLARSTQSLLLLNGGKILPTRLDSKETIETFSDLRKDGLILAESILLSKNKKRNGTVLSRLKASGASSEKSNLKKLPRTELKSVIKGANAKSLDERRVPCQENQGNCIQFVSLCELPGRKPFCVTRLLVSEEAVLKPIRDLEEIVVLSSVAVAVVAILIGLGMALFITGPLGKLMQGVRIVDSGNLAYKVKVKSRDEVGQLAGAFNDMAGHLERKIDEISKTNEAYHRFVPEEFLKLLKKQSILEIERGDSVEKKMSVLFSDIRAFTSLSEGMSPVENFSFINGYLAAMGPSIRVHGGFIDKYIGDAIMALFPNEADKAILAAIDMQKNLVEFNRDRNQPVNIGIGIHTGSLMLGIIGESERVEGTVISDSVNLASRLESLTKQFNTRLLISDTTYKSMQNPAAVSVRFLGDVFVKGKAEEAGLYEVLDCEPEEMRRWKEDNRTEFEAGIDLIKESHFDKANTLFQQLLRTNPDDAASKIYLELAKKQQSSLAFVTK